VGRQGIRAVTIDCPEEKVNCLCYGCRAGKNDVCLLLVLVMESGGCIA